VVCVEDGKSGDEDRGIQASASKSAGICRFALGGGRDRDADKPPSRARLFARQDTVDGDSSAEMNPESDRDDSPVPRCPFRPNGDAATASRPGDVLTDVILKLTFDNTAYVEETSAAASTTGVLPDSLRTYLLAYLLTYTHTHTHTHTHPFNGPFPGLPTTPKRYQSGFY